MRIRVRLALAFGLLSLLVVPLGHRTVLAAEEKTPADLTRELEEMPVLTGEEWQTLQPDTKVAFIWGVGHVVTIEENVVQRHPELKRPAFTAKLAEGLRGVPMSTIIQAVDAYYRNNPDDLDMPVLRVVWRQLVKPKLKTGIADRPLATSQQ